MGSQFNPDLLFKRSKPVSEKLDNVFMAVERYEVPKKGEKGFTYAVGHRLGNENEKIRVRLNTIKERQADRPGEAAKVEAVYKTGKYKRPSIADKAADKIPFLSFDQAKKLGVGEDGVTEYRAHWANTVTTDPNSSVFKAMAHVRLKPEKTDENGQRHPASAFIEVVDDIVPLEAGNAIDTLHDALRIEDEQGNKRYPSPSIRIHFDGETLEQPYRLFAFKKEAKVFDEDTGDYKQTFINVDADISMDHLMKGTASGQAILDFNNDVARTILQGLEDRKRILQGELSTNEEVQLVFNTQDVRKQEDLMNLYRGTVEGALEFDLVKAQRYYFGPETRKSYLKAIESNRGGNLKRYAASEKKEMTERLFFAETDEGELIKSNKKKDLIDQGFTEDQIHSEELKVEKEVRYAGYTDTVIALNHHDDGSSYAVFVNTWDSWPKIRSLKNLDAEEDLSVYQKLDVAQTVDRHDDAIQDYEAVRNEESSLDDEYDEADEIIPF